METGLPARVATATLVDVKGAWQRHVSLRHRSAALDGRASEARWGSRDGFPVLYLSRPQHSVVVEAYRHLVDPVIDGVPPWQPRLLVTCQVAVREILDLTNAVNRSAVGLTMQDLLSETYDEECHVRCRRVAHAAHQLGMHGILAPAATRLGETLALFMHRLSNEERPLLVSEEIWAERPTDPRQLRLLRPGAE